jgi:hypothetical protein
MDATGPTLKGDGSNYCTADAILRTAVNVRQRSAKSEKGAA